MLRSDDLLYSDLDASEDPWVLANDHIMTQLYVKHTLLMHVSSMVFNKFQCLQHPAADFARLLEFNGEMVDENLPDFPAGKLTLTPKITNFCWEPSNLTTPVWQVLCG